EISAILGENGAGKSTLAKILSGITQKDGGEIYLAGRKTEITSPRDAAQQGIHIIPQELTYVGNLNVAENLLLSTYTNGRLKRKTVSARRRVRDAAKIQAQYGFDLPLRQQMNNVSLADRQKVEILKAFIDRPRV